MKKAVFEANSHALTQGRIWPLLVCVVAVVLRVWFVPCLVLGLLVNVSWVLIVRHFYAIELPDYPAPEFETVIWTQFAALCCILLGAHMLDRMMRKYFVQVSELEKDFKKQQSRSTALELEAKIHERYYDSDGE